MSDIEYDLDGIPYRTKVEGAVLDYREDWAPLTNGREGAISDWLTSGETLSSASVSADSGITVDSSALADTNTSVVVWLSGGTVGFQYEVTVAVVTSDDREDARTFRIKMVPLK